LGIFRMHGEGVHGCGKICRDCVLICDFLKREAARNAALMAGIKILAVGSSLEELYTA
jgi:hypothetical protein